MLSKPVWRKAGGGDLTVYVGGSLCQHFRHHAGCHVFIDAGKSNCETPIHIKWSFSSAIHQSFFFLWPLKQAFLLILLLFWDVTLLSHSKTTSLPWPEGSGLGQFLLDEHFQNSVKCCIPPVLLKGHFFWQGLNGLSSGPEMLCEVLVTHPGNAV